MAETVTNRRRIDRLKALAIEQGFTNEDAKQFGKLSKTATWEALLETYSISLHPVDSPVDSKAQSLDTSDWTNDASFPVCNFTPHIMSGRLTRIKLLPPATNRNESNH